MRDVATVASPTKSLSWARLSFRRLFLPIFRGRGRFERAEKLTGDPGDLVNCRIESSLVCPGWFIEAADLPHELQRGSTDLFLRGLRFKIEKRLNVSTHLALPPRLFLHAFVGKEAYRIQLGRVGEIDDDLLRSGLLDLLQTLANSCGRPHQCLFAEAPGRDIAPVDFRLLHRLLVRLGNGTVEHDIAPDLIIVAPNRLTMLLDHAKLADQALVIQVPDITGITVLCHQLQRHLLARPP